jgi:acyl-CoA thioesterase-1
LIVALAANDGLRGVPISQVRTNLETIISTAQQQGIAVLLCGMETLPVHGWDYMVQFHHLFPSIAERYRVPLVPFLLDGIVANEKMLLPDFVHPNAAGALQMARTIWPFLQPMTMGGAAQRLAAHSDRARQRW